MEQLDFTRPETWRPVPGWPGHELSDKGRVRCLDRIIHNRWGTTHVRRGHVLTGHLDRMGYPAVWLPLGGNRFANLPVAPLELAAFAGPRPPGQIARHGPHGKLVNWWPENLAWGTYTQNNGEDRERDGTLPRGERSGHAKLTDAIVRECRRRHAAGETIAALAREFGVRHVTMSRAVRGVTWRHVV